MLNLLNTITTFVFDVDGVLTDGKLFFLADGQALRCFDVKDGYAMQFAVKKGFRICVISGGTGLATINRFNNLGITDVFLGIDDKLEVLNEYLLKNKIDPIEVLYMGDDLPDLIAMKSVGLPVCPADAVPEIKEISKYISPYKGGSGAARELIEKVLRSQGKWGQEPNNPLYSIS